MRHLKITWLFSIVLVAILFTACTQSTPTASPTEAPSGGEPQPGEVLLTDPTDPETPMVDGMLPEVDPAALSGDIIAAGSSTVYPLIERIADRFISEGFTEDKGKITIDSVGTGGGFKRFCEEGQSDISNASRPIKQDEIDNCAKLSPARTPIEFRVGTDALAITVSLENSFLSDITLAELAQAFSVDVSKWNQIRTDWPDAEIQCFSPGTDSGTFDYFIEVVMIPAFEKDEDKAKTAILTNPRCQFSEDDNFLVEGVKSNPNAIGYFGFAYFTENQDVIKPVSVEGVAPTAETAESGDYELARPLFIYSDAVIMKSKPQVAAFINYFLTIVNEEVLDVGYFPASEAALEQANKNWLDAMVK